MTPQKQLACQARQIECWLPDRGQQMSALLAIFVQLSNQPMTCASVQALAQQWACIPRELQLPALIALANSMQPPPPPPPAVQQVFNGNYGGIAPAFTPPFGAGLATDDITGQQWNYYNGIWQ